MNDELRATEFGLWALEAARSAGFDVNGSHGGARTEIARRVGLSVATVSRALSGRRIPGVRALEPLARVLEVQPVEMLVRAGLVSPEAADEYVDASISATRALSFLGIHGEDNQTAAMLLIDRLIERARV